MTSPVERISGPRTVSTIRRLAVRKRLKGRTASLTAIGVVGIVTAGVVGRCSRSLLSEAIVSPI